MGLRRKENKYLRSLKINIKMKYEIKMREASASLFFYSLVGGGYMREGGNLWFCRSIPSVYKMKLGRILGENKK